MKFFGNKRDDYFDSPMKTFPWPTRLMYAVVVYLVAAFSKIYWHWTWDGRGPSGKPGEGEMGHVVVANHASMFDPVVLILISRLHGRRLRPLYKSEFEKSSFVSGFFARVGAIPIRRGSADTKAIRRAVKAIGNGEDICVFPEGTRIRDPQARPELHGGFALIAQMAKCDVVPVAIDGTEKISPSGKGFSRPARVRIRFGEPIDTTSLSAGSRRAQSEALEAMAMQRVYALRDEIRAEAGKA